jgi:predicted amidohydrolase
LTDGRGRQALRVLLAQVAPVDGDVEGNARRLADVVLAHPSAELAVFPELFLTGYAAGTTAPLARGLDDPLVERVRATAAEAGTAIVAGFAERAADGAIHNAALCVDRDGTVAGVHRKTHLFGEGEVRSFVAGEQLHVLELAGRRIAPLICFEIEFPEPARAVARAGAELIVTIAANMAPYRHDHDLASRARALDNRTPHVYVNRVGAEAGLSFVGGSQVVDAGGRLLASAGAGEAIVVRDVPTAHAAAGDTDYLRHLRPGLAVAGAGARDRVI